MNVERASMAIIELTPANSHLSKLPNHAFNHQHQTKSDQCTNFSAALRFHGPNT